jgi:hypothetical protein
MPEFLRPKGPEDKKKNNYLLKEGGKEGKTQDKHPEMDPTHLFKPIPPEFLRELQGRREEVRRELPEKFEIPPEANIFIPEVFRGKDLTLKGKEVLPDKSDELEIGDAELPFKIKTYSSYPGTIYLYFVGIPDPKHPHAEQQIMRIEFDVSTGKILSLYRNVPSNIFRVIIHNLAERSPFWKKIQEILKIPSLSDRDIEEYNKFIEDAKQNQMLKDEILKLSHSDIFEGKSLIEDRENTSQIHIISQGEYTIADSRQKRYIATFGASDCIIVAAYNPEQKRGGMSHIDAVRDEIATLELILKEVLGQPEETSPEGISTIKIVILGGSSASTSSLLNLYKTIKKLERELESKRIKIELVIGEVLTGRDQSLALDLETGEIMRFRGSPTLHPDLAKEAQVSALRGMVGIMGEKGKKQYPTFSPPE